MPKYHLMNTVPGAIGAPAQPRVTERKSPGKLAVMRDIIPLAPTEFASTSVRNFRHVAVKEYIGGQPTGFDADPRPGYEVTTRLASQINVTASADDKIEKVGDVWVNGDDKIVRTTDMPDDYRVPYYRPAPKAEKSPKSAGRGKVDPEARARKERALAGRTTDADLIAFMVGRNLPTEKLADKRVRALVRDMIAHEAAVADYTRKG